MAMVDSVINLAKAEVTLDQMRVLGFGLSFNQNAIALAIVSGMANMHCATFTDDVNGNMVKGLLLSGFLDILESEATLSDAIERL